MWAAIGALLTIVAALVQAWLKSKPRRSEKEELDEVYKTREALLGDDPVAASERIDRLRLLWKQE